MVLETGFTISIVDTLCDTLSSVGIASFEAETAVVWVHKMFAYQGRGEKAERSAAAHLAEDLHGSTLCLKFLAAYPSIKGRMKPAELDRVSNGVSDFGTPESPFPIPDPDTRIPIPETQKRIAFGEFGHVRLSPDEHEKLKAKLNGNLDRMIGRLDRWGEEEPAKFRKKKSHYATILNWSERDDLKNGTPEHVPLSKRFSEAEMDAAAKRLKEMRESK